MEDGRKPLAPSGADAVIRVVAAAGPSDRLGAIWDVLRALFQSGGLDERQVNEISGVAALVLKVTEDPRMFGYSFQIEESRDEAIAELASMYAYRLGYHQGQQAHART